MRSWCCCGRCGVCKPAAKMWDRDLIGAGGVSTTFQYAVCTRQAVASPGRLQACSAAAVAANAGQYSPCVPIGGGLRWQTPWSVLCVS